MRCPIYTDATAIYVYENFRDSKTFATEDAEKDDFAEFFAENYQDALDSYRLCFDGIVPVDFNIVGLLTTQTFKAVGKMILKSVIRKMLAKKQAQLSVTDNNLETIANSTESLSLKLSKFETIIKTERNFEYLLIVDEIGKKIVYKKGMPDKVSFTEYVNKIPEKSILTHNHPTGSCFSIQDIAQIEPLKFSEIRAVTTKKIYILKRKGYFNMAEWQNKLPAIQNILKVKYPNMSSFNFEDKIKVQEELYQESFKNTNVEFLIIEL